MQKWLAFSAAVVVLSSVSCSGSKPASDADSGKLSFAKETRLKNIRQLTAGGTNAEAYWSFDGSRLSYQAKGATGIPCDQIWTMRADGSDKKQISAGDSRTTCAYYFPKGDRVLYSHTGTGGKGCPVEPDRSQGYVWPVYHSFQMYSAKADGSDVIALEPGAPKAYNAEATVCHDGSVVFTSDRGGDLELYTAKLDPMGSIGDIKQVTNTLGYDGGAFFSPDCKKIVWRASRPKKGKDEADYKALLKKQLVRPSELEIYVANADGTHARQVTNLKAASFAPFFTPDGNSVLFASNFRKPNSRFFDIFKVNVDGSSLEQVTHSESFDSFPMFSPDGKRLAFSSNRNASAPRETNVFVADWVDGPEGQGEIIPSAADRIRDLTVKLSAPEMEGRGLGTEGIKKAEALVAERFLALGLKPYLGNVGYFHPVETRLGKTGAEKTFVSNNVVGAWGCEKSEKAPVVIGAHLDHLGYGGDGSLEASTGKIHPGADDNASGVAAVLEIARGIVAADAKAPKGCVVFAAFTAEESGIIGSSRLMDELKSKGVKPKAMLNLDMVGRMESNHLMVFGTDTAREWKQLVSRECDARSLRCDGGGDGYGPSDQMAFYIGGAPVLHFFTGPHGDHHRASDTAEKINYAGASQVAELAGAIAARVIDPKFQVTFKKGKPVPSQLLGRSSGGGVSTGAYLGTIPDYSDMSTVHGSGVRTGVKLSGVREGSPAEKAGIKAGDVLTAIVFEEAAGGNAASHSFAISNLADFSETLRKLSPGMKIAMKIRREGSELKLPATVGKREQQH